MLQTRSGLPSRSTAEYSSSNTLIGETVETLVATNTIGPIATLVTSIGETVETLVDH